MKNPSSCADTQCPYAPEIRQNSADRKNFGKALLALMGEDGTGLNTGVIHDILKKLDSLNDTRKVTASWISVIKPIAIAIIITAATTYGLTRFFG